MTNAVRSDEELGKPAAGAAGTEDAPAGGSFVAACVYRVEAFWAYGDAHRISRVPKPTVLFWIIKCLCTALGETMADQLNVAFGENNTSQGKALAAFGCMLIFFLSCQFTLRRYWPPTYWPCILLISICGTLITDIMFDIDGLNHTTISAIFGSLLGATFILWFWVERTLSIHSIYTTRREAFFWLTVFFTFCLGTSTGDQLAEDDGLGYWRVLAITLGTIIGLYVLYLAVSFTFRSRTPVWVGIICFWAAYVLTRPLGASLGDLLTAPRGIEYTLDTCAGVGTSEADTGCDPDIFCITYYPPAFECNNCLAAPASVDVDYVLAALYACDPEATQVMASDLFDLLQYNVDVPTLVGQLSTSAPNATSCLSDQLNALLDDTASSAVIDLMVNGTLYAEITNPDCYDICSDLDQVCPDSPHSPNPCGPGESTCHTELPCSYCWGLDALMWTNIAFAIAVFVLVLFLTVTRLDLNKEGPVVTDADAAAADPTKEEEFGPGRDATFAAQCAWVLGF